MKTIRISLSIMVITCLCLWQCEKETSPNINPISGLIGVVTDAKTGKPIEGVKITYEGADTTVTDSNGRFGIVEITHNVNALVKAEKNGMLTLVQKCAYTPRDEHIELNFKLTDEIIVKDYEGNQYKTVTIGDQVWMAENLRSKKYADGKNIDDVWAYYNDEANVAVYGRLYNWTAAMKLPPEYLNKEITVNYPHQGVCPIGWHVPSDDEWLTLQDYCGGEEIAGKKLKTIGNIEDETGLWHKDTDEPLGDEGTNASGFSAVPGGGLSSHFGSCAYLGYNVHFWSSSPSGGMYAGTKDLSSGDSWLVPCYFRRAEGFSVRCVQD